MNGTGKFSANQHLDKCSPRKFRHLDYIGQFTTDIRYIKGQDNNVADALSRIEAIGKSVDYHTNTVHYHSRCCTKENDIELRDIVNAATYALRLKKIRFPDHDVEMYCDVLGDTVRPYAPKPLRRVFNSLDGLSHPGIRATQNLVTTRFVWTSINKDHRNWSRQCIPCQRCKDTRQVFSPTETFEALVGHFEHIHIDIVVMQYSQGYRYCLTCIDLFSRWLETIPIADMEASTVPSAFLSA